MGKNSRAWLIAGIIILAILFLLSSTDLVFKEVRTPIYNISVVFDDVSEEAFENFKKGVKQSYSEYTTDINYVTLYNRNNVAQQFDLIAREVKSGADAVIVFPVQSEELAVLLKEEKFTVPILFVDSRTDSRDVSACIYGDVYERGRQLGEKIVKDSAKNLNTIFAFTLFENRNDVVELQRGLREVFTREGIELQDISYEEKRDLYLQMNEICTENQEAVFIGMDNLAMQEMMEVMNVPKYKDCRFYGMGITDKILACLDAGKIEAVVCNLEYDMGYLSFITAISLLNKEKTPKNLEVKGFLVQKDEIHKKEMEKILFPMN